MSYRRDVEDRMENPNLLHDLGINKSLSVVEPAGQAVGADEIHLAWRGALKACGVSEGDRDAISQVVRDMLAASQAERPAVKEGDA